MGRCNGIIQGGNMNEHFTYKKLELGVLPSDLKTINSTYPWPKNEQGVAFSYFAHYAFPINLIDKEFIDILRAGNMTVKHSEVFYRPGTGTEFDAFIHTDGHKIFEGLAKINLILGGNKNIMRWYTPLGPVKPENLMTTKANTKYLVFQSDEVNEIDSVEMQGLYVVNAGIPHSVDMYRGSPDNPRVCLSIVPKDIHTGKVLKCIDVYNRLVNAVNK